MRVPPIDLKINKVEKEGENQTDGCMMARHTLWGGYHCPTCNNQFADKTAMFGFNHLHILAKQEKGQSQCDLACSY